MTVSLIFFLGSGIGFAIGCAVVIAINLYTQSDKPFFKMQRRLITIKPEKRQKSTKVDSKEQ
jgi:hypothetical protein